MVNILTSVFILVLAFWILKIIARKQQEVAEKEKQQREQFLKESQLLLKTEAASFNSPIPQESKSDNYCDKVSDYFKSNGYTITEAPKAEGIDLIGIQERELLLIRCESTLKEVKVTDLKLFIAECSVYLDDNPMFKGRSCIRIYASSRPITDEARFYARKYTASIRILEEINPL